MAKVKSDKSTKASSTASARKAPSKRPATAKSKAKITTKAKVSKPAKTEGTSNFKPLFALRKQFDEIFEDMVERFPYFHVPKIEWPMTGENDGEMEVAKFDFSENESAVTVTAELPGMAEQDIEVFVQDGLLTIKGEKQSEKREKGDNYYISERRFGSFSRAFRLPEGIKQEDIAAKFEKGILSVTMPKAKKTTKPSRRIQVKPKNI